MLPSIKHAIVLLFICAIKGSSAEDCDPEMIGFELVTGYVFSAPLDVMDSLPGTLMLTDCLESCQTNDSCQAVNYETGLCVLFSSNADTYPGALTRSQFPVFTIYAQKSCLGVKPCERAWCFDRVLGHQLNGYSKKKHSVTSRQECLELCLGEREFVCRSANYNNATGDCDLSDMDRLTVAGLGAFQPMEQTDYLENNCVEEPGKLCEFKKISGRILKTVDSVYQDNYSNPVEGTEDGKFKVLFGAENSFSVDEVFAAINLLKCGRSVGVDKIEPEILKALNKVSSLEECRELCLNSPYRCRSYDFGDTGEQVCRLSHHSRATLADIQDPYLDVPEAASYELSSCYNVSIECRSGDMVARIKTSKLFSGKMYAKGSPNSCVEDVKGSLEFSLKMAYDDVECNVRQPGLGKYNNDIVIQHHDTIVTSSDLGLAVSCQYDLTNKSVSNEVDLGVRGEVKPALSEEVVVDSPNVAMRITDRRGDDAKPSAAVGDPLALRFEILDQNSPYEIFVRDLVAMDGADSSEIVLIDSDGCPTDHFIMGPLFKSADSGKSLLSHFDAFKFPSSEVVQFRALVTPCVPTCEPAQCNSEDSSGELRSVISFGRRRRSAETSRRKRSSTREDMLLVQSIHISDKFGFPSALRNNTESETVFIQSDANVNSCMNIAYLAAAGAAFLVAQLAVIAAFALVWQKRKRSSKDDVSVSISNGIVNVARTDSLCKLYESGYARRF